MIYTETILDNEDTFAITRQKSKPNGEWYGISLSRGWKRKHMADSDKYIYDLTKLTLYFLEEAFYEMDTDYSLARAKILTKLLKKADKLGWFNHLKK